MIYDPHTPVDSVFNKIIWFQDLCILCNNQKSDGQLVQMAYIIFNRTKAFMNILLKWNIKLPVDKTYNNFKLHMRTQYHALREVEALTVINSAINQANLFQEMTLQQEKMILDIKNTLHNELQGSLMEALLVIQPTSTSTEDIFTLTTPLMNSTSTGSTSTMESLLTIIKNLESKVDKLYKPNQYSTNNNNHRQQSSSTNYNPSTDKINPATRKIVEKILLDMRVLYTQRKRLSYSSTRTPS